MGPSLDFACPPARGTSYISGHLSFHTRGLPYFVYSFYFFLIYPLQFVRNVGITHGDESRVGLYVGMMVCLGVRPVHSSHKACLAIYFLRCTDHYSIALG
jgi:hypothetical protein